MSEASSKESRESPEEDEESYESSMSTADNESSIAACIRNRTNFSVIKPFHMIDRKEFDPEMLNLYIDNNASPKLKLLLDNFELLCVSKFGINCNYGSIIKSFVSIQ